MNDDMALIKTQVSDDFETSDRYPFFARQPVFGPLQQLMAYDIVHCGVALGDDLETCIATRLDGLASTQMVFVAVTRESMLGWADMPSVVDGRSMVMVVAADIYVDDALLAAVNNMVSKGYLIALADFDYGRNHNALLPYADFIKISIRGRSGDALQELLASLHEFRARLIAYHVDTPAQFEIAREIGFDGFMGEFYCQPCCPGIHELSVAALNLLRLAVLVQEKELDVDSVEKLISRDVMLSYKLLRYINSSAFALRRQVESIRHAIILLGLDEIRKWSALVSILNVDNKPGELARAALWRANMCELLCEESGQGNPGTAFIVGLFSLLDAMFDQRLEDLLARLPLADDIRAALLQGQGDYAEVLACTCAYGRGDWPAVRFSSLMPAEIAAVYLRAVRRADQSMSGLYEVAQRKN